MELKYMNNIEKFVLGAVVICIGSLLFLMENTKDVEKIVDEIISIPALNTARIQESHILIGQMLCNALEFRLKLSPLIEEER